MLNLDPTLRFNSDHTFLTASIKVKLGQKNHHRLGQKVVRFFAPTPHQILSYNDTIRRLFSLSETLNLNDRMNCASKFSNAMHTAANAHFSKRRKKQNRHYLTEGTWRLIEQQQQARTRHDHDREKTLNAEIKKQAKADKTAWKIQQLETLTDTRQAWKENTY